MHGTKAEYLYNYCVSQDISFLAFDNVGCGQSSGVFQDQTMGIWKNTALRMIERFAPQGAILVGSSAGAWTALSLALAIPTMVKALICIAAAPDFTEQIVAKDDYERCFIEEARSHLLLHQQTIAINCPAHFIHGCLDDIVSYNLSMQLFDKILSKQSMLKLIKDGDHRLSRKEDLMITKNSLEEIIDSIANHK